MVNESRHTRLRLLLKKLNKQRKKQARQIDILCNDFLTAQKDFIGKLHVITLAANFYESILGSTDLSGVLEKTVGMIRDEVPDANVTFFLRQEDNFELHIFEAPRPQGAPVRNLENHFSPELMDSICRENRICTLDDLLAMGLQVNPMGMARASALTLPLGCGGSSPGFVLIYRFSRKQLKAGDFAGLSAVRTGLSRAIASCQQLSEPAT